MWVKVLCFVGGAALGYLAREQIAETVDTVCDKVSDLMESDAVNTVGAEATSVENEFAGGDDRSESTDTIETTVAG